MSRSRQVLDAPRQHGVGPGSLDDLSEPWAHADVPPLDGAQPLPPDEFAMRWHIDGYLLLHDFVPPALMHALVPGADGVVAPDARRRATADLCCYPPLQLLLEYLIGEPMAVHLDRIERGPTQRAWTQEGAFSPDQVADRAATVWFALDDAAGCTPVEFLPGSHRRLPVVRRDRVLANLPAEEAQSPFWRIQAERVLTPLYDEHVARWSAPPNRFLARCGDVLVLHTRLLHRVPPARDPAAERGLLLAHYSGVDRRPDLPAPARHGGGYFFPPTPCG
jgi:hypothetical protein